MKIECQISEEKSQFIDKICEKEKYTRAEFNRKAIEFYLEYLTKKYCYSDCVVEEK